MTNSTEELRRLLDERGVEYDIRNDFVTHVFFDDRAITFFTDVVDGEAESVSVSVDFPRPVLNGTVWLTPEQAVEAALGRGTCRIEHRGMGYYCSECGEEVGSDDPESELYIYANAIELWSHCPRCGREVVDA